MTSGVRRITTTDVGPPAGPPLFLLTPEDEQAAVPARELPGPTRGVVGRSQAEGQGVLLQAAERERGSGCPPPGGRTRTFYSDFPRPGSVTGLRVMSGLGSRWIPKQASCQLFDSLRNG